MNVPPHQTNVRYLANSPDAFAQTSFDSTLRDKLRSA